MLTTRSEANHKFSGTPRDHEGGLVEKRVGPLPPFWVGQCKADAVLVPQDVVLPIRCRFGSAGWNRCRFGSAGGADAVFVPHDVVLPIQCRFGSAGWSRCRFGSAGSADAVLVPQDVVLPTRCRFGSAG